MATPDDLPASTTGTLALALGGSADSFTGLLLELMCKADPGNRARLADAFPRVDAALRLWQDMPAPTLGSLRAAIAELPVDEPRHVWCVWSDNGSFEAPSLWEICATPEAAERERAKERSGSFFANQWDVTT